MHFTSQLTPVAGGVNDINYDALINVLSLVKNEITMPLPLATKFIERVQKLLDDSGVSIVFIDIDQIGGAD